MEVSEFCNIDAFKLEEEVSLSHQANGAICDSFRVRYDGKWFFEKRLKKEFANDPRCLVSLKKEFEVGSQLHHPHIVRYEAYEQNRLFLEYIKGSTLTQWFQEGKVEQGRGLTKSRTKVLRQIILDLLDGLQYLHQQGVLHLDLKPDNIMVTDIGEVTKIVDLGFCYTGSYDNTIGLTPHFAAPEQLENGTLSERTDLFAVGRIMEWANQQAHRKVFSRSIILRCQATKPEDRFESAAALSRALRHSFQPRKSILAMLFFSFVLLTAFIFFSQHHSSSTAQLQTQHPGSIPPDSARNGVYIVDWSGRLVPTLQWDTVYQAQAVALITPQCRFRISLHDQADAVCWGTNGIIQYLCISGLAYNDPSIIKDDYRGSYNTNEEVRCMEQPDSCALTIASNYRFPDGTKGYLPAFGELYQIRHYHYDEVKAALLRCGGDTLRGFHWSSTQHPEPERAWTLNFDTLVYYFPQIRNSQSALAKKYGTPLLRVRAFGALSK